MIIVKNRELLIPENERYIGTNYDTGMENRVFRIARLSQSGTDLSNLTFKVNLIFDGEPLDRADLVKTFDDNYIYLTWVVTAAQVAVTGTVFVCVTGNDTNDTVKWSSFQGAFYTEKSLGEDIETEYKHLINKVNQEIADRKSGDAAETTARQNSDDSLSARINDEKTARENANASILAQLNAEAATRETEDSSLQTQINQIIAPTGEAPSAEEVQNARIGADGVTYNTLGDAIRTQFTNVKSNVSEISIIEDFRDTQGLGYFVNGVNFSIVYNSNNVNYCNKRLLYAKHPVKVNIASGYKYLVATYNSSAANASTHIANTAWQTGEYTIPEGVWFAIQFRNVDNTTPLVEGDKYKLTVQDLVYIEEKPTLYHIIVIGQSLGNGSEGSPALTKQTTMTYIGKAFRFNGGARPTDGMENNTGVEEIPMLDKCCGYFDSLCEQDHTFTVGVGDSARDVTIGETISSAMGYWFCMQTGQMCLVSNHALGGKGYVDLKKGTIAYNNSIRAARHAKALCDEKGWNYVVYALALVHGEADLYGGISENDYKYYLKEWQNDYDADIKAITGQSQNVQLFASQTVASSAYNLETNPIANAVLMASLEDADIHYVCPQYAFPLSYASIHMNNKGYRALGEFFGFAIARKFKGYSTAVMYPIKSVLSGSTITLTFNAFGDMSLDTNNVAAVSDGHYGFELVGDTNGRSITNVSISGNTVVISLSGAPSSGAHITYAYKTLDDEMGKIGRTYGVRGNLRVGGGFNSMFEPYPYCPMWCAVFSVPLNWTA